MNILRKELKDVGLFTSIAPVFTEGGEDHLYIAAEQGEICSIRFLAYNPSSNTLDTRGEHILGHGQDMVLVRTCKEARNTAVVVSEGVDGARVRILKLPSLEVCEEYDITDLLVSECVRDVFYTPLGTFLVTSKSVWALSSGNKKERLYSANIFCALLRQSSNTESMSLLVFTNNESESGVARIALQSKFVSTCEISVGAIQVALSPLQSNSSFETLDVLTLDPTGALYMLGLGIDSSGYITEVKKERMYGTLKDATQMKVSDFAFSDRVMLLTEFIGNVRICEMSRLSDRDKITTALREDDIYNTEQCCAFCWTGNEQDPLNAIVTFPNKSCVFCYLRGIF